MASTAPEQAAPGPPTSQPPTEEIHILWTSEGMSCDGDTVSVTAATLPSIEDVLLGAIPGLPKVHLHNKVLAYETGDAFVEAFRQAARGELDPFILVVEGSVPNENINGDGYWTSMGNDPETGEPVTLNEWIDRLAPKAWAVVAAGTCATYGGIHAMAGNPTGCMGLTSSARRGCSARPSTRAATAPPTTSRPTSPSTTTRRSAR